jgi:isopentenyldiphosphate isomerase
MGGCTKEKFDVVNAADVRMYSVYGKEKLHDQPAGCYHRAVHVFIEVVRGRFLIQLKAPGTENENKWSSAVSGHVRSGESYKDAAIRETKEELGIDIAANELEQIAKVHPTPETGGEFVVLFTYLMDDETEILNIDKKEVKGTLINKLDLIVKDVDENRDKYSPAFVILLNMFLELYKK